jgi:hypothetical protein
MVASSIDVRTGRYAHPFGEPVEGAVLGRAGQLSQGFSHERPTGSTLKLVPIDSTGSLTSEGKPTPAMLPRTLVTDLASK